MWPSVLIAFLPLPFPALRPCCASSSSFLPFCSPAIFVFPLPRLLATVRYPVRYAPRFLPFVLLPSLSYPFALPLAPSLRLLRPPSPSRLVTGRSPARFILRSPVLRPSPPVLRPQSWL
ncbi:hypothetical protein FB451DRAFT_1282405 [Mycena latifolia]|nr:hypothetical protein FB451DRAFT_1282405 [Mycena latifolia]